jgi:hypothetical protein
LPTHGEAPGHLDDHVREHAADEEIEADVVDLDVRDNVRSFRERLAGVDDLDAREVIGHRGLEVAAHELLDVHQVKLPAALPGVGAGVELPGVLDLRGVEHDVERSLDLLRDHEAQRLGVRVRHAVAADGAVDALGAAAAGAAETARTRAAAMERARVDFMRSPDSRSAPVAASRIGRERRPAGRKKSAIESRAPRLELTRAPLDMASAGAREGGER